MYRGTIKLPEILQIKCLSLIRLGYIMNLFTIDLFTRVSEVNLKLFVNELRITELQDIKRLCQAIIERDEVNNLLREDIEGLIMALDMFIQVASTPMRSCGTLALIK